MTVSGSHRSCPPAPPRRGRRPQVPRPSRRGRCEGEPRGRLSRAGAQAPGVQVVAALCARPGRRRMARSRVLPCTTDWECGGTWRARRAPTVVPRARGGPPSTRQGGSSLSLRCRRARQRRGARFAPCGHAASGRRGRRGLSTGPQAAAASRKQISANHLPLSSRPSSVVGRPRAVCEARQPGAAASAIADPGLTRSCRCCAFRLQRNTRLTRSRPSPSGRGRDPLERWTAPEEQLRLVLIVRAAS